MSKIIQPTRGMSGQGKLHNVTKMEAKSKLLPHPLDILPSCCDCLHYFEFVYA